MARPTSLPMRIHTGMLQSLGSNMYPSIAKGLSEFIANAFDADASQVNVTIPFDDIQADRTRVRIGAVSENLKGIYLPLDETIKVVIADDGHGMTADEIIDQFLPINRDRRQATGKSSSESGNRTVMGRKGLGKLAGFGVAEKVTIRTKRQGENYATTFEMDYEKIQQCENMGEVTFEPIYEDEIDPNEKGTTVTLSLLRCDSASSRPETIENAIATNFAISGDNFNIFLNGNLIEQPDVEYEFTYPADKERDKNDLASSDVKVHENFDYPILFKVQFRSRGKSEGDIIRGPLPAKMRGARVYCNQRLAAGPTLFDLPTGMHNFHSQSYMECIVHADVLDQMEVDLISTNRSNLKTDNEVVNSFVEHVTELMRLALYEHSKFRDGQIERELEADPTTNQILKIIGELSSKHRAPAKAVLKALALSEGIESEAFQETAPILVQAINSHEVLVELVKSGIDPLDLRTIVGQLTELAKVERSDVLKVYRGRRNAISGLEQLQNRVREDSTQFETELHTLLKSNPWLIQPEYDKFITSDQSLGTLAKELSKLLEIDMHAAIKDAKRPDLVFLLLNNNSPSIIAVVELKSPNIPLDNTHLEQLEYYMSKIESFFENSNRSMPKVTGHLIGNLPLVDTKAQSQMVLIKKIKDTGPHTPWEVMDIPNIIQRAKAIHLSMIEQMEKEELAEAAE